MIKLNFITSLSTANETNRRFTTKFTAGDESLPLTPDHEKVTKRIVPVASGRAFITCLSTAKQKKKQFTTKFTGGNESLRLTPDHGKVTERVVPVASGRAFREQQLKLQNQEPEKGCIIQLRALIVSEQAKHEARVEEYRANFRRGFRSDPEPKANLLRVLEIILEVREEDDFLEQIGAKPAHIEFSFSYLKTRHSFHLVDPSPWPLAASLGVFMLTTGSVLYMQKFIGGGSLLLTGLVLIIFVMFTWWRDIIREATFEEQHTFVVQRGLRLGMVLFIVSEIMFFFAFFWAFFHSSLSPTFNIGGVWPPLGIIPIKTLSVPLTNTVFLLTSGASVTWAHHAVIVRAKKHALIALILTLILALLFTGLQVFEYYDAPFTISDSVFGSCFYLTTGFHGFHVFVGTISLFVSFIRFVINHYTDKHHFGFESGIWYWHFVDVVWLFLFVTVYWWGGISMLRTLHIIIKFCTGLAAAGFDVDQSNQDHEEEETSSWFWESLLKVYRYFRYGPRGGDAPESCTGLNFQPEDAFEESSVTAAEAAKLRPVTLLGGLDPILEEEPEEDLLFDTSGGVEEIPAPALRPLLNPGVLLDYANLGANSPMSVASQEEAILASMAVALLPADWGLFHLHTRYSSSGTVLNTIWLFRDMLLFWTFQSNDQPLVFLRYYGLGAVTDYVPYIVGLRTTRASAAPIPNVVKMFGEAFTTLEAEAVKALGPEVVTQVPDADQVSAVLSLLG